MENNKYLEIEEAQIKYRNFAGREGKYNREGDRNFCVVIEDENLAKRLIQEGWNVRVREGREEGEKDEYILQVKVSFRNRPPKIHLVTGKGKPVPLTEETVESLDYADIKHVNLVINPYPWNIRGDSGISAYLKIMWVEIEQDPFAERYASVYTDPDDMPFN